MGDGATADYTPLDLASVAATAEDVARATTHPTGPAQPPLLTGPHTFRGLPFELRHVLLEPGGEPVDIPVGRVAPHVVVAHRQLATASADGWALGEVVATYRFHLAGGEVVDAPIRERWEIHVVPVPWGLRTYLALPDEQDGLWPRWQGPLSLAHISEQEAHEGVARALHLWAWRSPQPDLAVERIELVPGTQPVLVAGITTSALDEHPFARDARQPIRITIADETVASQPFDLAVHVDRGVASWPHPLPVAEPTLPPGFGRAAAWVASPAHADVSATPSATVEVCQGGEPVGAVRWGDVLRDGSADDGRVRVEVVEDGKSWVHVTVLDDATGQPVPCRVHFESAAGVPYQPHGHPQHALRGPRDGVADRHKVRTDVGGDVLIGHTTYAYVDGACQGWLPWGDVRVEVARGFEYEPLGETVRIERGQRELTLRLRRAIDMRARGWWSGDGHVHFLSGPGALFEQQAEDCNVVHLLQAQWGAQCTGTAEGTGRVLHADRGDYVTWVSQENRQHALGHLNLWGLREPVVPWSSDGAPEAEIGGGLDVSLAHWADAAHAQGATVVLPHFPSRNGEPAALVATGRVDAVEVLRFSMGVFGEWYRYLDAGYRLPLVGGTDKMGPSWPLGQARTYARIPDGVAFSVEAWNAAVRAGRTFYTSGPMLELDVDGHAIGDTVLLRGPGTVDVRARCESILPVGSLQVVVDGEVVAETTSPEGARELEVAERVTVTGDSWIAARCGGHPFEQPTRHVDDMRFAIAAHTSPIYVACGGAWSRYDPDALDYLLRLVEGGVDYITHTARHHHPDRTTHAHGGADHLGFLLTPWDEARSALHARLHAHGRPHAH